MAGEWVCKQCGQGADDCMISASVDDCGNFFTMPEPETGEGTDYWTPDFDSDTDSGSDDEGAVETMFIDHEDSTLCTSCAIKAAAERYEWPGTDISRDYAETMAERVQRTIGVLEGYRIAQATSGDHEALGHTTKAIGDLRERLSRRMCECGAVYHRDNRMTEWGECQFCAAKEEQDAEEALRPSKRARCTPVA